MKSKIGIVMAVLLLSGCGTTWINLDNTKAAQDSINAAKAQCNHDSTLVKLKGREVTKDAKVVATSSIEEKQALEDAYAADEKQTLATLNACMAKQGLKPLR